MYKKISLSFIACFFIALTYGQTTSYTLQKIVDLALTNNPATHQKDFVKSIGKENQKLISANVLPDLNISEQNTFQSEVTSIDIPGFNSPKKDNYNIGLDFRLPLNEFGLLNVQKNMEEANTNLALSKLDVDLQHIRERVTAIYGNILLQKENRDILILRRSDLEAQHKKIAAGVASGAVLKSNQLIFESEILASEQRLEETKGSLAGLLKELSILTGIRFNENDDFQLPAETISDKEIIRPESAVFKAQADVLSFQTDLLKKENRPKLFVYGQGLYGRPGYNFLDTSFRPYGTIGLGISFNINNSLNQSRHIKVLYLNKQVIAQQEETFRMNLQSSLEPKRIEINTYQSIISKDQQILNNRKEIIHVANSQLENGVITPTEYLTELNAENTAQLNLTLHQVQLALAIVQYNTLLGY